MKLGAGYQRVYWSIRRFLRRTFDVLCSYVNAIKKWMVLKETVR